MSKPTPKPSDAKVIKTEPLSPSSAHWTSLHLTHYTDPTGKPRTWEHAARPTRPSTSPIDGVGIVALITESPNSEQPSSSGQNDSSSTGPMIVLQKQFRPPIGKVMIEIPAGLVDEGEGAAEAAVRELREETGFVGVVGRGDSGGGKGGDDGEGDKGSNGVGGIMYNDPGFCTTSLSLIHLQINPSSPPSNLHPTPQLEENEFIEVFTVPLRDLYKECRRLEVEGGYGIDARVGCLAEGIELARRWGL